MEQRRRSEGQRGRARSRSSETVDVDKPAYKTDAFRMMVFKVAPCSKKFCHDWTVCPFAHHGEKARRRNPRTHDYTGVACPDMKKDSQCPRGDQCPYAHNVFEYWLHPTRYRTQLCNDGARCTRNVCFFAHNLEELRMPSAKPFVSSPVVPLPGVMQQQQQQQHQQRGGHQQQQQAQMQQGAVLQGSADSLAAQLAWLRLQGADPFSAPQLDPTHRASAWSLDQQVAAAHEPGQRHDSVASVAGRPGAFGDVDDWNQLGARMRGQSDPGFGPHERVSYEASTLAHAPWSIDAVIRSSLQGQANGLTDEQQQALAQMSRFAPQSAMAAQRSQLPPIFPLQPSSSQESLQASAAAEQQQWQQQQQLQRLQRQQAQQQPHGQSMWTIPERQRTEGSLDMHARQGLGSFEQRGAGSLGQRTPGHSSRQARGMSFEDQLGQQQYTQETGQAEPRSPSQQGQLYEAAELTQAQMAQALMQQEQQAQQLRLSHGFQADRASPERVHQEQPVQRLSEWELEYARRMAGSPAGADVHASAGRATLPETSSHPHILGSQQGTVNPVDFSFLQANPSSNWAQFLSRPAPEGAQLLRKVEQQGLETRAAQAPTSEPPQRFD